MTKSSLDAMSMSKIVRDAILAVERAELDAAAKAVEDSSITAINVITEEDNEGFIGSAVEKVRVRPAMDSGAVGNVLHPKDLPAGSSPVPNTTGKHFCGPKGETIEKYGTCKTICESALGKVGCDWNLADVTRPLNSVSVVTGPLDGPAKQDVLFNNEICVVVPPGIVKEILKRVKPIMEYPREGNLYVGDVELSAFGRQGQAA